MGARLPLSDQVPKALSQWVLVGIGIGFDMIGLG
jgi:hypothetical protein